VGPFALNEYGIALEEVVDAIQANNRNVGAQFLVLGAEEYLVRGIGLLEGLEDLRGIQLRVTTGTPIRLGDVANVEYGKEIRRGVVTHNGKTEVVSGMVLQLFGENTSKVIERLYSKIPEVQASLPKGVSLIPYYEQAELVAKATGTVKKALLMGIVLVTVVLIAFLGNLRSAVIVILSLPLCALISVICMKWSGLSANLMSLGGIAIGIGMIVDGSVVMVESIFRHLTDPKNGDRERREIVLEAAKEVGRPIVFAISIIVIVFLPIFTLTGVEGKMFSPMASTLSYALLGSMVTALVVAPALSLYLLKRKASSENAFVRKIKAVYRPLMIRAVDHRRMVVVVTAVVFLVGLSLTPILGTAFLPTLEEGSIFIGVTMPPSISLTKATETVMALEKKIVRFQEVEQTISRIGRPEAGSHPHPVNYAEIHVELKPKTNWRAGRDKNDLVGALNQTLSDFPGVQLNFTQPIQNAFDELLSGVKTQLAVKLFGEDLNVLRQKAAEIEQAIKNVEGLVDLSVEQSFGQPQVQVVVDREACATFGVNTTEILGIVELAVGGEVIDQLYLNTRRFGIHLRYQEPYRADPEAIKGLLLETAAGYTVRLAQVARVNEVIGPIQINREDNQRRWVVQANVRGRDMGSVVADMRDQIAETVNLPPGYYVEFGGQFENQQRAMARLSLVVPIAILLILLMLYFAFGSLRCALLIIINVPLALVGGIVGLVLTGEYLSVPASVGFIALFGIAVLNGVVLVTCINQLRQTGLDAREAVIEGCLVRVRPVLMTALTTVIGLVPLLLSQGIGSEVQRPLAVVVVFGLLSSTALTLLVIPALYGWFLGGEEVLQAD